MKSVRTTIRYTEDTIELFDAHGNAILSGDHRTFNDMMSKAQWVISAEGNAQMWIDDKCIGAFEAIQDAKTNKVMKTVRHYAGDYMILFDIDNKPALYGHITRFNELVSEAEWVQTSPDRAELRLHGECKGIFEVGEEVS